MSALSLAKAGPPFLIVPFILYNIPADKRTMLNWKDQWAPMKPFLLG
jgi:hypothetical protein